MAETAACGHCGVANPAERWVCLACGAPLGEVKATTSATPQAATGRGPAASGSMLSKSHLEGARKAGEKLERAYSTAMNLYAYFWRTLVEAVCIAAVGFGIGLAGGATSMSAWGVIGATVYGAIVGLTLKNYLLLLLSAPLGVMAGAAACALLWLVGATPKAMVFALTIFAGLSAYLGGYTISYSRKNPWDKGRPFLGALGGLAFGLLGMLTGVGLQVAVKALFEI